MRIDVLTLFPAMFAGPLDESIIRRARDSGILDLRIHNLRDWTHDRHKTVDDRPFGGGPGMVLKPEPIFEAETSRSGGIFQEVFSGFFAGQLSGLRPQTTREMPARSV